MGAAFRAAYVCADPGVPVFGAKGSSMHVQEVIRALGNLGGSVDIFATRPGGDVPPRIRKAVRSVHALPPLPKGDFAPREQAALANNPHLRDALAGADAFDFVYERYALWSFAAMEYAASVGVPGLLEVNSPLVEEQAAHRGLADRVGAERASDRAFTAASALLAVSDEVAEWLRRRGVPSKRVHVVPNGVDPDRFPPDLAPTCPAPPGVFTVGFLGMLKPWHGLPVLLEAFDQLHQTDPDTRLLVVGDGTERGAIEAEVARRGLAGAVELPGAVGRDEVPGLLASMDVATAPYAQRDGDSFYFSPLKLYEYLAAGLPVVASEVGQVAKVVREGVEGLLCPPGDAAALAGALGRLKQEPELRRRLGRAARDASRKHTWDAVAERILDLTSPVPVERRLERITGF